MMGKVVDFHSHILPEIDDGSRSVEESIALLRMEAEQGIDHVVATPHFYAHRDNLDCFLEARAKSEQHLRGEMAQHDRLPKLHIGAEVYYFSGIGDSKAISDLTIDATEYILIEMPHPPWTEEMYREMERLHMRQGLTPIIAHVDRYISRFRTFGIPEQLAGLPVLVQANAAFFLDIKTASMAMKMLRDDRIHLLGSDCHNLNSRKPNLGEAVARIENRFGAEVLERINQQERMVLHGIGTDCAHDGVN